VAAERKYSIGKAAVSPSQGHPGYILRSLKVSILPAVYFRTSTEKWTRAEWI